MSEKNMRTSPLSSFLSASGPSCMQDLLSLCYPDLMITQSSAPSCGTYIPKSCQCYKQVRLHEMDPQMFNYVQLCVYTSMSHFQLQLGYDSIVCVIFYMQVSQFFDSFVALHHINRVRLVNLRNCPFIKFEFFLWWFSVPGKVRCPELLSSTPTTCKTHFWATNLAPNAELSEKEFTLYKRMYNS